MDKLDLIVQRINDLKENTNDRLDSIDNNLAEHMRRTDTLEQLHKDNSDRIQTLEEPKKALIMVKNVLLYIAAASGAVLGVTKLFGGL